jgi:hypothetical protein
MGFFRDEPEIGVTEKDPGAEQASQALLAHPAVTVAGIERHLIRFIPNRSAQTSARHFFLASDHRNPPSFFGFHCPASRTDAG